MTVFRALAAVLATAGALLAPTVADAAAWLPATPVSAAGAAPSDLSPAVALGPSGDAAVAWWESTGISGEVKIARRPAGGTWSAPATLFAPSTGLVPVHVVAGVDANGNVTAAWSASFGVAGLTATVATWRKGDAEPTAQVQNLGVDITDRLTVETLAVNAAGDAVIAGPSDGSPSSIIMGYRHGPDGAFDYGQKFGSGYTTVTPRAAINATGTAAVTWRTQISGMNAAGIFAALRVASDSAWTGPPEPVWGFANGPSNAVAVDPSGAVVVAFTSDPAGTSLAASVAVKQPGGAWQVNSGLSPATGGASDVGIALTGTGSALLTWTQAGAAAGQASVQARVGSIATGVWGPAEIVNDTGSGASRGAIDKDGRAVVTFLRLGFTSSTAQARSRAPDGTWSAIATLTPPIEGSQVPQVATDGRGNFATASTTQAAPKQVLFSLYDAGAPVVSPVAFSGSPTVGGTLSFAVTASDEWSAVPAAPWVFGDGATAPGLATSHVYANAGTYAASITVTDAAGNSTVRQVPVTVAVLQSTLTSAKLTAKWKFSRVAGTLAVKGTVPRAGAYFVDVTTGKKRVIHQSYTLPVGAFSKTLKLPSKLAPGTYRVELVPPFPATQVTPAAQSVKLAAPAEGVIDKIVFSSLKSGSSVRTLRNVKKIWIRIHFVALPKGNVTLTWSQTTKGKTQRFQPTTRGRASTIVAYLGIGDRKGTFTAALSRKGVVIAKGSVKAL